jgi:RimJ/RimL family protein N-acetyltransferase
VTLQGRYVRLEPLSLSHVGPLWKAASGPRETFALTFVPDSQEAMRRCVELALSLRDKGEAIPYATVELASGEVAGSTRFMNLERWPWPEGHPLRRDPDALEIGSTWLAQKFQRTALNTEAKLLMLTHAFEAMRVHRVLFKTDARNERSRRNIERVGAKFDGILRAHMPASDGSIRDSAFYSILASEWPAAKSALQRRLR